MPLFLTSCILLILLHGIINIFPRSVLQLQWSLAHAGYHDVKYRDYKHIDGTRHGVKELSKKVLLDNVRFFPFIYENFEAGKFTLEKWRHFGDGAPWRISEENAIGRYSAFAGPTPENPVGLSSIKLSIDLGYTGALLKFHVKTRTGEHAGGGMLRFYLDGQVIKPFYGDMQEFEPYTMHIKAGIHTLQWTFECTGNDPDAGVWLDEIKFTSRAGQRWMYSQSPAKSLINSGMSAIASMPRDDLKRAAERRNKSERLD